MQCNYKPRVAPTFFTSVALLVVVSSSIGQTGHAQTPELVSAFEQASCCLNDQGVVGGTSFDPTIQPRLDQEDRAFLWFQGTRIDLHLETFTASGVAGVSQLGSTLVNYWDNAGPRQSALLFRMNRQQQFAEALAVTPPSPVNPNWSVVDLTDDEQPLVLGNSDTGAFIWDQGTSVNLAGTVVSHLATILPCTARP